MASRTFDQFALTIPKRMVELFAFVAVPTGTTPVLQKYNYPNLGVGGRTLSAATVSSSAPLGFPNNYQRILHVGGDHSIAGGTANIIQVVENPSVTNLSSANGSVIGIALLSSSATLADPTAGATSIVRIHLVLADATEP